MDGPPRKPLVRLTQEQRRRILDKLGLDEELLPMDLTPGEKRAAAVGPPDPRYWDSSKTLKGNLDAKEKAMEVKPGWKTSELWLKLLAGAGIALLGFSITQGLPAIAAAFQGSGVVGAIVALTVPLAKAALGWALHKLSETYADNRTEAKVAAANDNGEAKAA